MHNRLPRWKLLFRIFMTFLKIGPVTFGGGYAMIPHIEREVVERQKWMSTKDIANIFAVAESIPGAIAINSSAFIGFRLAGTWGAIVAMVGMLFPTFIIVILLSVFFMKFQHNPYIEAAFISIRATIIALIAYAAYMIGRTALFDKSTGVLIISTVLVMFLLPVHPVLIIIGGSMTGIGIIWVKRKLGIDFNLEKDESPKYHGEHEDIGGGI
jgi:chromate transporter